MKIRYLTRVAGCKLFSCMFLAVIALPALAGGHALSTEEISALVSGKTLEGTNPIKGFKFVTYFAPDGTFRRIKDGNHEQGTWSVTPNNELCMTGSRGTTCRIIKKEGGVWNAYKIRRNLMRLPVYQRRWVRVLDGNPHNL
jgi:hypothetical protein